jgi:four helix bundle protein
MRDHKTLRAWQVARGVAGGCIRLAAGHWSPARGALLDQVRRAAISVQLNLTEGYALGTPAMFRRHVRIAYGSAVETTDALELLHDFTDLHDPSLHDLVALSRRSQALLLGLLRHLNKRPT